jgi:hypothetical protein
LPAVTPSFAAVPEYRFLAWHGDGSESDFLLFRCGRHRFSPQIIRQLVSPPQMEKSVEYLAVETLRGLVPKDHVILCDKAVFPAIPLGLDIEVARQI